MTVRLYDSKAQALRDFVPLEEGHVGMYVCGPTVQSAPHIGHLRSALVYDIMRRWFAARGYRVTFIRNVTDIDDKILNAAAEEGIGEQWWSLAYRYELEFTEAYNALGILPPTYEPRATASVTQMQQIIQRLIELGHAYPAPDGSGDVYFDTSSWPVYGELTRQSRDKMEAAADSDPRGKRDPRDFALWKGHKPSEPVSAGWESPWGAGRPGWHIECSAMAARYLGPEFDLHGGGLDLRFPHHENELAQSTAAGQAFARYWVHNGLVNVGGQKMSKSLGNSVYAYELTALASPLAVRYLLGKAHYRSTLDYSPDSLAEAEAAVDRIRTFLTRVERRLAGTRYADTGTDGTWPEAFAEAMDDDLNVPQALAVLHEAVSAGNQALDGEDLGAAADLRRQVLAMVRVLGIDPSDPHWTADAGPAASALDGLVMRLIADRRAARDAKDWDAADRIRAELADAGITIEDSQTGTHWSLTS
ncbi:cysteinyl-tRNA synthetase [Agromyces flavus]|uniref:Cysteine--tRNA ligase n=1 Tax=Agromyces flavus TaxID=589382 RepID=A0A1H1M8C4_9MICO|nr:cysteine--tRNA ligase [Agromyces flavus]MCP2368731.1 cysteinyl-tRNA synthetase [Agromyces flavus]GGI48031.1 cysteine--tRNA ligase [Agromyces flavus]SDR82867.1 cysteinyl-tRNA synthetase [Agromyces flavus]